MAPRRTSTKDSRSNDAPALQEIVFSCGICYALPTDVYVTKEHNKGFHSGSGEEQDPGIVTKFWIAECSHVFCGRHLENGGKYESPPFHPHGQRPRAPCPVCATRDARNTQPKELFGIRGLEPGQCDDGIPEDYFQCPPIKLNTNTDDSGLDALKFQYSHISTYAAQVSKLWKADRRRWHALEHNVQKERQQWETTQTDLKAQIAELEKGQAKLRKWEQRKTMINHYLGLVGKMGDDIKKMRAHLAQLGYEMPEESYSYDPDKHNHGEQSRSVNMKASRAYSSATLVGDKQDTSSSSLKRKHRHDHYHDDKGNGSQTPNAQAMMPPPLPIQRHNPQHQAAGHKASHFGREQSRQSTMSDLHDQHMPQQIQESSRYRQDEQLRSEILRHSFGQEERPQVGNSVTSNRLPDTLSSRNQSYGDMQHSRSPPIRTPVPAPPQGEQNRAEGAPAYSQKGTYFCKPPRRQSQQYHETDVRDEAQPVPRSSRAPAPSLSRITYFNPAYRTQAQQSGEHAPREMMLPQPAATSPTSRYRPVVSAAQRQPFQQPTDSVVSSFFKPSKRSDTTQRPAARGMDMRQRPDAQSYDGYRLAQAQASAPTPLYSRTNQAVSRGRPQPSSRGVQSYSRPPSEHQSQTAPCSEPGRVGQPQYASQPQYDRFQPPPSSARSCGMAPPSSAHRNRITLPPSSSRAVGQDAELSRIPGVRGGGFPANIGRPAMVPPFTLPRSFYSAAGNRRGGFR